MKNFYKLIWVHKNKFLPFSSVSNFVEISNKMKTTQFVVYNEIWVFSYSNNHLKIAINVLFCYYEIQSLLSIQKKARKKKKKNKDNEVEKTGQVFHYRMYSDTIVIELYTCIEKNKLGRPWNSSSP